MREDIESLIKWHEERLAELGYPPEVVMELRQYRNKFISSWRKV